jgi:hypothetical protein
MPILLLACLTRYIDRTAFEFALLQMNGARRTKKLRRVRRNG